MGLLAAAVLLAGGACSSGPDVPPPADTLLESKLPDYESWGIHSADELRARLQEGAPGNEDWARTLDDLGDHASALLGWRTVLAARPHDLHAVWHVADQLYALGEYTEALAVLSSAPENGTSSHAHVNRADLDTLECLVLQRYGRSGVDRALCEAGLAGAQTHRAHSAVARLLLRTGDAEGARPHTSWLVDHAAEDATAWFLHGVAEIGLGRVDEAHEAWDTALRLEASHTPAARGLAAELTVPADLIAAEDDYWRAHASLDLAVAGHLYLDLGIFPERVETCFAAADRLEVGPAESQQIWHLSETDRDAAVTRGRAFLQRTRQTDVLLTMGWLARTSGDTAGARALLEEGIALDPRDYQANINLAKVCEDLGDTACVDAAYARALGDPETDDVLLAIGLFVALLVPLAVAYWFVRKRLVRKIAVARAREAP